VELGKERARVMPVAEAVTSFVSRCIEKNASQFVHLKRESAKWLKYANANKK
jgi:hypothetical protein